MQSSERVARIGITVHTSDIADPGQTRMCTFVSLPERTTKTTTARTLA